MNRPIVYEHPLNERVRVLLRLEHLFGRASHYLEADTPWDSRAFVASLMEILDVFGRADLKTELLKEVERALTNLDPLLKYPGVDHERLKTILRALERMSANLHAVSGQLGQELKDNEFLATVRQRVTIPGGTCDFDLPGFHFWLEQPPERRQQDQNDWYASLDPVRQTVELLLKLMRNSAEPRERTAAGGVYQQSLDSSMPFQMLRIMVPRDLPYFAETSGGKHRFTVRFMLPGEQGVRASQTDQNVTFRLSVCSL